MDDAIERIKKRGTVEEFRVRLIKEIQELQDEIDDRQRLLDAMETGEREPPAKYEVINDVLSLILNSEQPLPQSEIVRQLRAKIMAELDCREDEVEGRLARSLWYHTTRKLDLDLQNDLGLRAVERRGDRWEVVPFKTRGAQPKYPDNLIWHVSKIA